jgi:hypothetical protein
MRKLVHANPFSKHKRIFTGRGSTEAIGRLQCRLTGYGVKPET